MKQLRQALAGLRVFPRAAGWLLITWGAEEVRDAAGRLATHADARAKAAETVLYKVTGVSD